MIWKTSRCFLQMAHPLTTLNLTPWHHQHHLDIYTKCCSHQSIMYVPCKMLYDYFIISQSLYNEIVLLPCFTDMETSWSLKRIGDFGGLQRQDWRTHDSCSSESHTWILYHCALLPFTETKLVFFWNLNNSPNFLSQYTSPVLFSIPGSLAPEKYG